MLIGATLPRAALAHAFFIAAAFSCATFSLGSFFGIVGFWRGGIALVSRVAGKFHGVWGVLVAIGQWFGLKKRAW